MLETTRIGLASGVTLKVQLGGPAGASPIILLHGFPESHRTWRKVAPALADRYRIIAPDQRGFGGSDRPSGVEAYRAARAVDDLFALADALGLRGFTLVGHDWGGAVAWAAALRDPARVERLVIVNAPHPLLFQKSLIEDSEQRAASQYMRAFRSPLMEKGIEAMGLEAFFERTFAPHVDLTLIPPGERRAYLDDWGREGALTAMLNWYRASGIEVPPPDEEAKAPLWTRLPFPKTTCPVLVVWGMRDKALLPVQLDGLESVTTRLDLVEVEEAGHFLPWERPEPLVAAIGAFMARPLERPD